MHATTAKVVLITGGSRRLGREVAFSFARRGVDMAIHCHRSEEEARGLVQELQELGVRAWALRADLTKEGACEGLIDRVMRQAGSLDVLVNNAATYGESRLLELSSAELAADLRINGYTPLALARSFAKRVSRGTIVNLLDCRMVDHDKDHVAYHLSKRLLRDLTRLLALELAPDIRVNGVAPGMILPPPGEGAAYLEERRRYNPLHEVGSAKAVTDAVHLLVESGFLTGQVIFVDGGRHLKGDVYG